MSDLVRDNVTNNLATMLAEVDVDEEVDDLEGDMMEDQRKWENLNMDCLVNIFSRLDMESLLLDIPFVCKSWHKASLNPSCWKQLIFPEFEPDPFEFDYPIMERFLSEYRVDKNQFNGTAFIKFVINRSCGNAFSAKLPSCCTVEAFEYLSDVCPGLGILGIPRFLLYDRINVELIGKWKNLIALSLGCCSKLEKILEVVSKHCKYLSHLVLSDAVIKKDDALSVVNLVPNIKRLSMQSARIDRDNLITLLQGCKDLVFLDARNCIGFNEDDEEISRLASNIPKFKCEGSKEGFDFPFSFDDMMSSLTEDDVENLVGMFDEVGVDDEADEEADEGGEI